MNSGGSKNGEIGLFCEDCSFGFSNWNCQKCGRENNTSRTAFELSRSDCFIATAVYGSRYTSEVELLRQYRDEIMMKSLWGKVLIMCYEKISPPIAKIVSKNRKIKLLVRDLILSYLVKFVCRSMISSDQNL